MGGDCKLDAATLGHDDRIYYLVCRESAGLEAESGEAGPSRHVEGTWHLESGETKTPTNTDMTE